MKHSALSPVFTGLQLGLHGLVTALIVLVIARSVSVGGQTALAAIVLAVVILLTYAAGAILGVRFRRAVAASGGTDRATVSAGVRRGRLSVLAWLVVLSVEWVVLVLLSPDAAYLVFPLFFLYLHLLPRAVAVPAVVIATIAAVVAIGLHAGFSVGGVVGPLVGAAVAVAIGLGYEALAREAAERERLIAELVEAREELAERGRQAGKLAERERLAADLHDTVAQALSSIQLLLHAAERSAVEQPGTEQLRSHIGLAREAAATALAETRSLIDELSPPALVGATIADALGRLAETTTAESGTPVSTTVTGDAFVLGTPVTTALLRAAQSSLANVVRHAAASRADVTLTYLDEEVILDIDDDGTGFDPARVAERTAGGSFGMMSMRRRITELGGDVEVRSAPGAGTTITVRFAAPGAEGDVHA
ncbi:Signal transduction histidine kinase [Plantibacter sp. VKM Ac-1784]|uniref:Oxygen sensor histidine kinase NreB n=1 Tax=Plantibacter elymi (nom. nud.) TaxID=199708 RepID=A0ABY1RFZ2_9MICO|nr:sensor histidine kinase [Plantibacter sp. VKM Ac-1784]SMQ73231.1 Signal transduction histidine kinase [Plantibacter sp. VKM Ac-1784]